MTSRAHRADMIDQGCIAFDLGDLATAAKYFEAAAKAGDADARFNLGNVRNKQGEPESAVTLYRKAFAQGVVEAGLNLGVTLVGLGRQSEAEVTFREAWKQGDEGAGLELGWLLVEAGKRNKARKIFARMARQETFRGRTAAGVIGVWRSDEGKRDEKTVRLLRRGLWAYRDAAPELASILIARGKFAKARRLLETHIAVTPRSSVVLGNLLLDHFDDPAGARAAYQVGVDAGDEHARDNLERIPPDA